MPSVNDNIADAIEVVIATNGGTYTSPALDTNENTTEVGEVSVSASANVSAWWYYDPASSGTATFDTMLSTVTTTGTDTYMAIWTGTNFADMVQVAGDDDSGGGAGGSTGTSRIAGQAVTGGTRYWIQVGGFGNQTMNVVLRVTGPASEAGGGAVNGDVIAVPATATATVLPPLVEGTSPGVVNGTVVAVPATATATAIAPTSVQGETIVSGGGPATATATAHPPVVSGTSDSSVAAVPATAGAVAHAPVASGVSNGTVQAFPATATAAALVPIVAGTDGSSGGGQGFLNAWYSNGVAWIQV